MSRIMKNLRTIIHSYAYPRVSSPLLPLPLPPYRMKILKPAVCLSLLALAACAQQPSQPALEEQGQPAAASPAPKPRVVVRAAPTAKPAVLPAQAMSQSVLFKLLLAEIALQ